MNSREKKKCRLCGSKTLKQGFSLGHHSLANSYIQNDADCAKEERCSLRLMKCSNCENLQLSNVVNAEDMFKNYQYVSSTPNLCVI